MATCSGAATRFEGDFQLMDLWKTCSAWSVPWGIFEVYSVDSYPNQSQIPSACNNWRPLDSSETLLPTFVLISLLCLSWKRFHSIDWLDPRGLQLDRFRWFRCLLFRWPTTSATRFPSNPRVDLQAHISRKPSMLDGQIHVSSPWLPIDFTWFYLKSIHIDWFGPWIPTFWVEWYLEIQMIDRRKCHWPNRFPMLVPS
jgi:hypothetical protein